MIRFLDTNICIYLIKKKPISILEKISHFPINKLALSSISVAELEYGVEKSAYPEQNLLLLQSFLLPFSIYSFDEKAARCYGKIRNTLEKKGTPIGNLDTLIAAHALSLDAILVTHNTREFKRVSGLALEDWTIPA